LQRKNVFLKPGWLILFSFPLAGFLMELNHGFSLFNFCSALFIAILISCWIFYSVFPFWPFDENGFEKNLFGFKKRKYSWKDVHEIQRPSSDAIWILTKNNVRTVLGKMLVRNYEELLFEVVRPVQINSPDAKIDPWLLEHCKKEA
jgi:hypothetical protein